MPHLRILVLASAITLLLAGCAGDPLGRQALSGFVRLRGEPLEQGSILFLPSSVEQTFSTGAMIQKGAYTVPRDKGLPPGVYRVVLSSHEPTGELIPGSLGVPPTLVTRERIPVTHGASGTATIKVQERDANRFDFDFD